MLDAASYTVPGAPYQPVQIDADTLLDLKAEEVYVVDFRKYSPLLPVRFFRSMIPEVAIAVCGACGHFFHQETWELEFLQHKCCPYCGNKDIDSLKPVAVTSRLLFHASVLGECSRTCTSACVIIASPG